MIRSVPYPTELGRGSAPVFMRSCTYPRPRYAGALHTKPGGVIHEGALAPPRSAGQVVPGLHGDRPVGDAGLELIQLVLQRLGDPPGQVMERGDVHAPVLH